MKTEHIKSWLILQAVWLVYPSVSTAVCYLSPPLDKMTELIESHVYISRSELLEMVLPIIIGLGVTIVALTARSGIRAWEAYKLLSPMAIARMNNIKLRAKPYPYNSKFQQGRLNESLRARLEEYRGGFHGKMTESEALLILNISSEEIESLDEKMLKRKYRMIMLQNHPDKGGSPYLAMKLNEAREVLEHSVMLRRR